MIKCFPAMAVSERINNSSFKRLIIQNYMSEEKAIIANLKKVFLMVSGAALQKIYDGIEKQQHY